MSNDNNIVDLKALANKKGGGGGTPPAQPEPPELPTYEVIFDNPAGDQVTETIKGFPALDPIWLVFMEGPGDIGRMIPYQNVHSVTKLSDA